MRQPVQFRAASAAAKQPQPEAAPAIPAPAPAAPVSFANDIMPLFKQFQGPMMWRFDLTSYEAVKANASIIYARISGQQQPPMPPPPFPPLQPEQVAAFQAWMDAGFPP